MDKPNLAPSSIKDSLKDKIESIAIKVYGARSVVYSKEAEEKLEKFEKMGFKDVPVCISKTQYSFSDDAKNLLCEEPFDITVRDVRISNGAGFVVVYTGNIMTMPGLPKVPAANNIDVDENNVISGLF